MAQMSYKSGYSNPYNYLPVDPPTILKGKTKTVQDCIYIFGSFNPARTVEVNENNGDGWQDLISAFYMANEKFMYAANLQSGINTISFRCKDVEGNTSSQVDHVVNRVERDRYRYRSFKFYINGVLQDTKYLMGEPQIDMNKKDGILQIQFMLKDQGINLAPRIEYDDIFKYELDDGLTTQVWEAPVTVVDENFEGAEITQECIAQSTTDALPRLSFTGTIRGTRNGEIVTNFAIQAGYNIENVFVPLGNKYVNRRNVENLKVYDEIIQEIIFIESWGQPWLYDADTFIILPPEANRFVSWSFMDSQLKRLNRNTDSSFIFNRCRLAYEETEDDLNINFNLEDKAPDKSDETTAQFNFYESDLYENEVTQSSPNSVLFFAAFGNESKRETLNGSQGELDWENITKARIIIKFNNTSDEAKNNTGGSLLKYTRDLEVFPDKKVAVGYFDLKPNHLLPSIPVYYQWVVADANGEWIGNTPGYDIIELGSESDANFEKLVTKFGVQMSEPKEIAEYSGSWYIDEPDNGPTQGDNNVFYSRYDRNNDQVNFFYQIQLDFETDVVLDTISFDFDASPVPSSNTNDEFHLLNAQIVTDDNKLFNGNDYISGLKVHEPNIPVNRVDAILLTFVSNVNIGDTISMKFHVYGREYEGTTSDFSDPSEINVEYTDLESVDARTASEREPAVVDAGVILNGFVSTRSQALGKLKRIVKSASSPVVKEQLITQGYSEMREGQLIRVFSSIAGQAYNSYYFIKTCNPSGIDNQIEAVLARKVRVSDETGYTEPVAPDLAFDLSDLIENLDKKPAAFEFGTVLKQKYRGMYQVKLDSDPDPKKHVISRVSPVNPEDKVAVAQTRTGSYVILFVVKPSVTNLEFDDFLAPNDEVAENWQNEIDNNTDFGKTIPQPDKPLGDYASVQSFSVSQSSGQYIPYRGVYFLIKTSHDFNASARPQTTTGYGGSVYNITNFIYFKGLPLDLDFTVEKVEEKLFKVTINDDLSFNASFALGVEPISVQHPRYQGKYNAEKRFLTAIDPKDQAFMYTRFSNAYTVQPALTYEVLQVGPDFIDIKFNQVTYQDEALDKDKYNVEIHEDV